MLCVPLYPGFVRLNWREGLLLAAITVPGLPQSLSLITAAIVSNDTAVEVTTITCTASGSAFQNKTQYIKREHCIKLVAFQSDRGANTIPS